MVVFYGMVMSNQSNSMDDLYGAGRFVWYGYFVYGMVILYGMLYIGWCYWCMMYIVT